MLIYQEGSGANLERTQPSKIPLSKIANLIHKLLALEMIVRSTKSKQEPFDDDIHVLGVTHTMENLECLQMTGLFFPHGIPDRYILAVQRIQYNHL